MTTVTTLKWKKSIGSDGFSCYAIEGHDASDKTAKIQVLIKSSRERECFRDSQSSRIFYYGCVLHRETESASTIGRFRTLKEAKEETLKLFEQYCEKFPIDATSF